MNKNRYIRVYAISRYTVAPPQNAAIWLAGPTSFLPYPWPRTQQVHLELSTMLRSLCTLYLKLGQHLTLVGKYTWCWPETMVEDPIWPHISSFLCLHFLRTMKSPRLCDTLREFRSPITNRQAFLLTQGWSGRPETAVKVLRKTFQNGKSWTWQCCKF